MQEGFYFSLSRLLLDVGVIGYTSDETHNAERQESENALHLSASLSLALSALHFTSASRRALATRVTSCAV